MQKTTVSPMSILEDSDDAHWEHDVSCLVVFLRDFDYGLGTVIVFEREGRQKYSKKKVFAVPTRAFSSNSSKDDPSDHQLYRIKSPATNPRSDQLFAVFSASSGVRRIRSLTTNGKLKKRGLHSLTENIN